MLRRRNKWFWRTTALCCLLILSGLVWTGWYVYYRGFTRKWRNQLAAELHSRGLDFSARKLTLNPFEGLVVEDANLYALDEERHTPLGQRIPLLYLKKAAVDINYINLILKKPFLNSIDVRNARLSLPVDTSNPNGLRFKLRNFQAKFSFQPDEVRITQAEGDCYGVQLSVSGTLSHPKSFSPSGKPTTPEEMARRLRVVHAVIEEIQKVRAERNPPRLEIRFQGDMAKPAELRASAVLSGEALQRGYLKFDRLYVRLNYEAGAFRLRQAELSDGRGSLSAEGDFNPTSGEARFQLQSTFDLPALAREFYDPALLTDFNFSEAPHLQFTGRARVFGQPPPPGRPLPINNNAAASQTPSLQISGRVGLGSFAYRAIEFSGAESEFSWRDGSWYLRGLRVSRPGGQQLEGDILSQPNIGRVKLSGSMNPAAFANLLPPRGKAMLAEWKFHDPPRIDLTITGPSLSDPDNLRVAGKLTLERTLFRGVGFNRLQTDFTLADRALTYRRFTLEREEGIATGDEFVYDFAKHEVRMQNVHASLDPSQVAVWMDPDVVKALAPFRFRKAPSTVTNGVVQFDGGRNSRLTIDLNAPAGLEYTFIKKPLSFRNVTGQILLTDDRLRLNDLKAQIFDGQAQGTLDLSLVRGAQDYTAALELQDVDFARLTKLYFDYDDSKGKLDGLYRFKGRGDDPRTLRGMGRLKIDQGNVFSIPFLGPLSTTLSGVAPGLGFDVAHEGSLDFLTASGKIYTGNLNVKGLGFSMFGAGWLGYVDDTMNFRVRINARGLPGAVLYPVSKLLEYGTQGPLNKPVWRPRVFKIEPAASNEKAEDIPPLRIPLPFIKQP